MGVAIKTPKRFNESWEKGVTVLQKIHDAPHDGLPKVLDFIPSVDGSQKYGHSVTIYGGHDMQDYDGEPTLNLCVKELSDFCDQMLSTLSHLHVKIERAHCDIKLSQF